MGRGEAGKLLCVRRDLKPAAMFLFESEPCRQSTKGKNREGRPEQNFRQEIYAGQIQLLPVASGFERRSVVRVLPIGKGEYREPGLQENPVRNFTGRRYPPAFITLTKQLIFPEKRYNNLYGKKRPRMMKCQKFFIPVIIKRLINGERNNRLY